AAWPYSLKLRGAVPTLANGTELRIESPDGDFAPRDFTVPATAAGLTEFASLDFGTTTLMAGPVTFRVSVVSTPLPGQEIALDALSVEPIRTLATDVAGTAVVTATSALSSVLNAFDNDPFSGWTPTGFVQNHLEMDLGAAQLIERMQLSWAVDSGIDYVVQLSADGLDFVSIEGHADGVRDGRMDLIEDIDTMARFIRIVYLGDDLLTTLPTLTDVQVLAE
ncbi:MAG: discoidin domain-containing protein, partial [Planctomycetota bacterium]